MNLEKKAVDGDRAMRGVENTRAGIPAAMARLTVDGSARCPGKVQKGSEKG